MIEPGTRGGVEIERGRERDATSKRPHALPGARAMPMVFAFIAGAIFWHLVGFWGLVSDMVFHGPREKTAHAVSDSRNAELAQPDGFSLQPGGARSTSLERSHASGGLLHRGACTTLLQDKPGGVIRRVPCPIHSPTARDAAAQASATEDDSFPGGGEYAADITTGSIAPRSVEGLAAPQSGWAASLDVGP